jgi:gluconokinase
VVIVIMGAAGAGKTTIGRALAAELGWAFVDADDLHPPPNAETRHASLRAIAARALDRRESLVLACPPLSERNREALRSGLHPVRFVFLEAMTALEGPAVDEALHIDATRAPERILAAIRIEFGV